MRITSFLILLLMSPSLIFADCGTANLNDVKVTGGGLSNYIIPYQGEGSGSSSGDWQGALAECHAKYDGRISNYWVGTTLLTTTVAYNSGSTYRCIGNVYGTASAMTCPSGATLNPSTCTCVIPPLSTFNNDPQGCSKAGGTFMSYGAQTSGGSNWGSSFFGGSGVVVGAKLNSITKCASTADIIGDIIGNALNFIPLGSMLFKSKKLKTFANLAWMSGFNKTNSNYKPTPTAPKMPDTFVLLPKLKSGSNPLPAEISVTASPVPETLNSKGDLGPSRAPEITVDSGYTKIADAFIPIKSNGDAIVDYSVVDLVNDWNIVARDVRDYQLANPNLYPNPIQKASLREVIPQTFTYSKPVRETFDFSKMLPDSYVPINIGSMTGTTTLSKTYEGTRPIDAYKTVKNYPDNSSAVQVIKIDVATGSGLMTTTTLAPTGESNTVSRPIVVSGYNRPTSDTVPDVKIQFVDGSFPISTSTPVSSTSTTPNGNTVTNNPNGSTTTTTPDGTTIINNVDGSITTTTSGGISSTTPPISPTTSTTSNGNTVTNNPNGSTTTTTPDGTTIVNNFDGSTSTTSSSGATSTTPPFTPYPTTPITTISPDGTTTVRNPDGSMVITDPNGIVTNTPPTLLTLPDGISNQNVCNTDTAMPSYTLPDLSDFIPFDSSPITDMISSGQELFSNINNQLASSLTVFNTTKAMIKGSWTPPIFPSGSCGDSMAFDFHGKRIDLCPPLVENTAKYSPIVSGVGTVAGMGFAFSLILGGF